MQAQLPSAVAIVGVEIYECGGGYARVFAVPDNSRCPVEGVACNQDEQVFLKVTDGNWAYLTNGSGINCRTDDPVVLGPSLLSACRALGLREVTSAFAGIELALQQATRAAPLLVPTVPTTWKAAIGPNAGAHGYGAIAYTAPDGHTTVTLSVSVVGNLPISQHMATATRPFRSDLSADYQIDDTTAATSARHLVWNEPGTWAGTGDPTTPPTWRTESIPYLLSADGLTDVQFWQIADSLHARS